MDSVLARLTAIVAEQYPELDSSDRAAIAVTLQAQLLRLAQRSPAPAYCAELRRLREQAGLTHQAVQVALEWSLSKVHRVETGDSSVQQTDLRALLALYGVDPADVPELLATAAAYYRQKRCRPKRSTRP